MRRRNVRLLLALSLLGLLVATPARADTLDFSYAWSMLPSPVIPSGTGSVQFSLPADGTTSAEIGGTTPAVLPGATVTTTSSAETPPDVFNANFSMGLKLGAGGETGSVTFAGSISGSLTATTSELKATFSNPTTQKLTLGDYEYTVTISPSLISIPAPGATTAALIDAQVLVAKKVVNPPPPVDTPEPSALLLGATAVAGLAARRWLRRQAA